MSENSKLDIMHALISAREALIGSWKAAHSTVSFPKLLEDADNMLMEFEKQARSEAKKSLKEENPGKWNKL